MRRTTALGIWAAAAGTAAVAAAMAPRMAYADDITMDPTPFASTRSRAEVLAELPRYSTNEWTRQFNDVRLQAGRSRVEATREYLAVRDQVRAFGAEDSGSAYLGRSPASTRVMGASAR